MPEQVSQWSNQLSTDQRSSVTDMYHDNGNFCYNLQIFCELRVTFCYTILQAFYEADDGQKGWLSAEDYKVGVVMLLGYKPSKVKLHVVTVERLFCGHFTE